MKRMFYRLVIALVTLAMPLGAVWAFWVLINTHVGMIHWSVHRPAWWLPLWYVLHALFVLGAEAIAVHLIGLVRTVENNPFIKKNIAALRRMGWIAIGMTAVSFGLCFYPFQTWLTPTVCGISLFAGLFAFVLADVIDAAVARRARVL